MGDDLIVQLRTLLGRGIKLAWVHEGTFMEIRKIEPCGDEERAFFADGTYADMYNVPPTCVVAFQYPFLIR